MVCILAEKYDAAKSIAYAIGNGAKRVPNAKDPTFSHWEFTYKGEQAILIHARGHIIQLAEPKTYGEGYKNWDLSVFPLLPNPHRKCVADDIAPEVFAVIADFMRKADWIISATDNDREGDIIFREIYDYLELNTPYKRAIYDDLNENEILAAFHNLAEGSTRRCIENAGLARELVDYDIGNNLTVVATKSMPLYVDGKQSVVLVGRVKTATLALVVERERAIKAYQPSYYYRVQADFGFTAELNKDYKDKAVAEALVNELQGKNGVVKSYDVKVSSEGAPKLYNTTKIQSDANKLYGYSPKQVSDALEKMYSEYKIITYPRTQSVWLSDGTEGKVKSVIKMLMASRYSEYAIDETNFTPFTKKHFDSSKFDSHPAIMPTLKSADGLSLTEIEERLYDMICRKALALALPLATYNVKSAVVVVGDKEFIAKSKTLKDKGWKVLYDKEIDEEKGESETANEIVDVELPPLSIGQVLQSNGYGVRTITVEPPRRFTLGTLLEAMERAGQNIDDDALAEEMITNHKALGTGATRDTIIDDLIRHNYISTNGKSVYATSIGEWIIDNFPIKQLTDVLFTAELEHKLFLIQKGEYDYSAYCTEMQNNVKAWCDTLKASECKPFSVSSTGGLRCPSCHRNIVTMSGKDGMTYWICENWREIVTSDNGEQRRKCNFILPQVFKGATLSLKDVECLCNDKPSPFHTFINKEMKEYKGCLKFDKFTRSVGISYEIDNIQCPVCKGAVKPTMYSYQCVNHVPTGNTTAEGYKEYKCPFAIQNPFMGAKLSMSDIKRICNQKASATKKFKKDDKEFYGAVTWDNVNKKIKLEFYVDGIRCPICKGTIKTSEKNWHCENNEVSVLDENGEVVRNEKGYPLRVCNFFVPKEYCGGKLTEGDVKNLCNDKITRKIEFVSQKTNKPYTAALRFNKQTRKIDFEFEAIKNICPICKKGEIRQSKEKGSWYCSNFKNGCGFYFPHKWGAIVFDEGDMASLSKTGYSKPHKMKSQKNGREFTARFAWNVKERKLDMIIPKSKK